MREDDGMTDQDRLYAEAAQRFAGAIARLARGYEADAERARDLEQDMHVALWRSLGSYRGEAALSTWVWRVALNVGASHVAAALRAKRAAPLVPIADVEPASPAADPEQEAHRALALERLYRLIHGLKATDRQVVLLYLEEVDADGIAEITGLSPGAVATRIHRIKTALAGRFTQGVAS